MNRMAVSALFAGSVCIATAVATADDMLTVHATEANAQISPRNPGQAQAVLPALDVEVIAELNCAPGATAESVTFSVADTHIRFDASEIDDATTLKTSLHVPASQIAPISSADFCIDGTPMEIMELLLPGVASAQVSLHCRRETISSMHFASVALPLRLSCEPDEIQSSSTDK